MKQDELEGLLGLISKDHDRTAIDRKVESVAHAVLDDRLATIRGDQDAKVSARMMCSALFALLFVGAIVMGVWSIADFSGGRGVGFVSCVAGCFLAAITHYTLEPDAGLIATVVKAIKG
jgi:hypothetical protein